MDFTGPGREPSSSDDFDHNGSPKIDPTLEQAAAVPETAPDALQRRGVWVTTGMFGADWQQQQGQPSEPRPVIGNQPVTTGQAPYSPSLQLPPRSDPEELLPRNDSSSAGSRPAAQASNSRPETQPHQTDSSTSEPEPLGDASATGTGTETGNDTKRKPQHIGPHAIAEQRKQRRLAKNREAAAVSRERKRAEMARLQERVQALEHENAGLSYTLSLRENELGKAKEELASLRRGASGDSNTVHAPASAAPGGESDHVLSESSQMVLKEYARPPSDSPAVGMHTTAGPDPSLPRQQPFQQQQSGLPHSSSNEPVEVNVQPTPRGAHMRSLPNMLSGNNQQWRQLVYSNPHQDSGPVASSSNTFPALQPNHPHTSRPYNQACHQGEQQFCAMDAGIGPAPVQTHMDARTVPAPIVPMMDGPGGDGGWPVAAPTSSAGLVADSEAIEWEIMDPDAFPGDLFDWPA